MKVKVEMRPGSAKGQCLRTEDGELIEGVASIAWKVTGMGEEAPKVTVEFFATRVNFDLTEPEPYPHTRVGDSPTDDAQTEGDDA